MDTLPIKDMFSFIGIIAAFAVAFYRLVQVEKQVESHNTHGTPFTRERFIKLEMEMEHHHQRMAAVDGNSQQIWGKINEIDKKMSVVSAWVEEQKDQS